ncbi:MAG: flippase [Weeksellaceae bacterium]|nr:flippase [Weeksellaceae bacterium]
MKQRVSSLIGSRSIKVNYVLNLLRVISAAMVVIFTMPYLNRILGAESIGKVEYVNAIITYFVLFSALGIPMYGIREVSRSRNNIRELYTLVAELYLILLVTTILSYSLLFGLLIHLNVFSDYRSLLVLMSAMILLSNMGAEWYFQGTENQLFITIRYVTVRLTIFALYFLLIKAPEDDVVYAVLLVILNFGANILNFGILFSKIYKNRIRFSDMNIRRHLKPIATIFLATVAVNIYLQLDIFLIGFLSGDKNVGYYTVASKLIRYVISFITIIGAVLLPRLSYLYLHDKELYHRYLVKSFDLIMLFAIPFSIYFFVFADAVIMLMAGTGFSESVLTMRLLSPLCIVVCLAYYMGFLILYPQSKERIYTRAVVVAALVSILVNYFAISHYRQNGAAVVSVIAEILAVIIMYLACRKDSLFPRIMDRNFLKIIMISAVIFVLSYLMMFREIYGLTEFVAFSALFFVLFFGLLTVVKEKNCFSVYVYIKSKLRYRDAGV